MAKPREWLAGTRPRTLPAAVVPVLIGSGVALGYAKFSWWRALLALAVALALQIGVNYANDYSDGVRGSDDKRVGPVRLVAAGLAPPRQVLFAALGCFVLHRRIAPVRLHGSRRGLRLRVLRRGGGGRHGLRADGPAELAGPRRFGTSRPAGLRTADGQQPARYPFRYASGEKDTGRPARRCARQE